MPPRGRPTNSGLDGFTEFCEVQRDRTFSRLWVTLPHGHDALAGERRLHEIRRETLLDAHEALVGLRRSELEVEVRK